MPHLQAKKKKEEVVVIEDKNKSIVATHISLNMSDPSGTAIPHQGFGIFNSRDFTHNC
jgi:hypothetical protein